MKTDDNLTYYQIMVDLEKFLKNQKHNLYASDYQHIEECIRKTRDLFLRRDTSIIFKPYDSFLRTKLSLKNTRATPKAIKTYIGDVTGVRPVWVSKWDLTFPRHSCSFNPDHFRAIQFSDEDALIKAWDRFHLYYKLSA